MDRRRPAHSLHPGVLLRRTLCQPCVIVSQSPSCIYIACIIPARSPICYAAELRSQPLHGHCYSDLQNCENNLKPFYGTSLLSLLNNFKVPTRCMKLETNSFLSRFLTICTHLLDDWHGNVEGDRDVVWLRYGVYHAIHHARPVLPFFHFKIKKYVSHKSYHE